MNPTLTSIKQLALLLVSTMLVFTYQSNAQVIFKAGNSVNYNDTNSNDVFIAGGNITINSPVKGDAIIAGGKVHVMNSIDDDLMIGGGEITVNGEVGDDIRIFGGEVQINKAVKGDIIVFGGQVDINQNANIGGDLILFTGEANIYSTVGGNTQLKGGEIKIDGELMGDFTAETKKLKINGVINGKSTVRSEDLYIGDNATFNSDVLYYNKNGEIDFKNSISGVTLTYDESLKRIYNDHEKKDKGFAGFGFSIWSYIAMVLVILCLTRLNPFLSRASLQVKNDFMSSLGWGILFMIILPIITFILMITIIGIPLGFVGIAFIIIAAVTSKAFAALIVAHYLNRQYNKSWSGSMLFIVSVAIYTAFRLLNFIPFLGWLIVSVMVAIAFGSIIIELRQKKIHTLL